MTELAIALAAALVTLIVYHVRLYRQYERSLRHERDAWRACREARRETERMQHARDYWHRVATNAMAVVERTNEYGNN